MSLEQWVEIRVLRAEPTSPEEIKALIGVVETRLNDAKVELISDDWRFAAAYNALLTSATIALRAKGYRVPNQAGHHTRSAARDKGGARVEKEATAWQSRSCAPTSPHAFDCDGTERATTC